MKGGLRFSGKDKASAPNQPLLSIITVVLNGEKHLRQAMESVLAQEYPNVEYIVIDGNSADATLQIIREKESQIDYWQSERDEGIFDAMNKGIALAKGEIIGILNADDFYEPGTLTKVAAAMSSGNAQVLYGNMRVVGEDGKELSVEKPDIALMDQKPSVFHPTCFVRREVYERIGAFDTRFRISSDYEFLLRCIRKQMQFRYLDEVITNFRPGGMSASCASNIEGYRIMKMHRTGYHRQVIWRAIRCYLKQFIRSLQVAGK